MSADRRWNDTALDSLEDRLESLEDSMQAIRELPTHLAGLQVLAEHAVEGDRQLRSHIRDVETRLTARFMALETRVHAHLDRVEKANGTPGLKQMIGYASIVLVPIILALIGGYVALRSAIPR